MDYQCPTAKTGLFGGAAFLALDAALFWLVCQMLALNARADYLDEDDGKGEYGQIYAAQVDDGSKVWAYVVMLGRVLWLVSFGYIMPSTKSL